jgi:hypothetical protein
VNVAAFCNWVESFDPVAVAVLVDHLARHVFSHTIYRLCRAYTVGNRVGSQCDRRRVGDE